jgi:murein DD-endopeptidase MepM/ murein hydrolase activator NlpD
LLRRLLTLACSGALALALVPAASARWDERPPAGETGPAAGLIVPANGELTSTYGPRWGRMHHGVDYGILRELGVVAAAAGTVVEAGRIAGYEGYGKTVVLDHGDGRETLYAHLSTIRVSVGDAVAAGAWLGNAGCTGSCTGTHLHFELRERGVPLDPLPHLHDPS